MDKWRFFFLRKKSRCLVVSTVVVALGLFIWVLFPRISFYVELVQQSIPLQPDGNQILQSDDYLNKRYLLLTQNSTTYELKKTGITNDSSSAGILDSLKNTKRDRFILRQFSVEDTVRCFDSLSANRQRKPMHIAFVGDSTLRQHFLSFLEVNNAC